MNIPEGTQNLPDAPWNDKEDVYYRDVEVIYFLERKETVRLECNIENNEILDVAKEEINRVGNYLAKSLDLDYIDYDFTDKNDKFEK